jgi:hypothetical protein
MSARSAPSSAATYVRFALFATKLSRRSGPPLRAWSRREQMQHRAALIHRLASAGIRTVSPLNWRVGLMTRSNRGGCSVGMSVRATQRAVGLDHCHPYSMISVTRISSDSGISIPRDFAVCRFITTSNLVDSSTGKFAGLVPLRILLT